MNPCEDGRGIGQGNHFFPNIFIKRTFNHRVNSTKELLNAAEDIRHPEKQPIVFKRRWRSLEATVKIKLKTRSRRLKSKS